MIWEFLVKPISFQYNWSVYHPYFYEEISRYNLLPVDDHQCVFSGVVQAMEKNKPGAAG